MTQHQQQDSKTWASGPQVSSMMLVYEIHGDYPTV